MIKTAPQDNDHGHTRMRKVTIPQLWLLLFPGTNFVWISGAELSKVHTPEPQFKKGEQYYGSHVGGHLMLPTIRQAIDFVITDPVVVTLKYV